MPWESASRPLLLGIIEEKVTESECQEELWVVGCASAKLQATEMHTALWCGQDSSSGRA